VSPPAAEREVAERAVPIRDHVHIGEVGADQQGQRAPRGTPAKPAPGQAGADQRVADRIYASLASSSS
jgi:hypothetical protein